ncbi:MAG: Biotin transporter BioY [Acidimicrobiales bacterium AG-410-I20]|nr:MAG: Biotin transporter BioY [Acidimicrobiales bacterium AG-410-I20]
MTAISHLPRSITLIDLIPRSRLRDVLAVSSFALLTAGAAQISIPLGFTPVPITGQTFAVLLAGGVLGSKLGAASQMFYVILGALGLPFYADGAGGWEVATGSTAGYLVGFVVASFLVGLMAERGQDRNLVTSLPAFIAGSIIIYTFGALWLAYKLDIPLTAGATEASAVAYGVTPFIVGDILKAALAGVLLPGVWRLRSNTE